MHRLQSVELEVIYYGFGGTKPAIAKLQQLYAYDLQPSFSNLILFMFDGFINRGL